MELINYLFGGRDYKPVILYEYTQGETSFVHYVYSCEVRR
jgi:hypothetical protein